MTTSVTINLPVTAKFDGCWCSEECEHMSYNDDACFEENAYVCLCNPEDRCTLRVDKGNTVRTDWCKATFGMGEEQDAQPDKTTHRCALCGRERDYELRKYALCSHCEPDECDEQPEATEHEIWTNIDGTTVDLTQNAIDNETLRRWTSE